MKRIPYSALSLVTLMSAAAVPTLAVAQDTPPTSQYYDPVPAPLADGISATDRDVAPISLRPDVTCVSNVCTVRMKSKWGGTTMLSEPLPFNGQIYDGDDWFPRAYPKADLPGGKSYGWTVGYDQGETDIFVTDMLQDKYGQADWGRFIVEQRAGYEHVGRHFRVLATDMETGELYTAFELEPAMGPVAVRVEPVFTDGIIVHYDWLVDDIPTPYPGSIFYEWAETEDGRSTLRLEDNNANDHFDEFAGEE